MATVRRSFIYTLILICRRTWRLWNHGLRKVPIWKMLDKVPDSFKTVQCNEHRFAFFWIPHFGSFFRRRQASPVPPRLQVQPWEDKGENWPLQLVQVETNLNAISVWRESVRVGLIFFLEKKWPLRASLPDWFEPWDPSGPIFQKVLNFRWEPQKSHKKS